MGSATSSGMSFYWLLLGVLAVWRVTHFFHAEDGPWKVGVRLRARAGAGFFGALLDCFYCLSVWVALPAAALLGESWRERLFLWPALSAGAILWQRIAGERPLITTPPIYQEDPEKDHVLLRPRETTIPDPPPDEPGGAAETPGPIAR